MIWIGLLFSLLAAGAGYGVLSVLGVRSTQLRIGLSPTTGLALLAVASTWITALPLSQPAGGLVIGLLSVGGLLSALRQVIAQQPWRKNQVGILGDAALFVVAIATPVVLMGVGVAGLGVPLSTHDGLAHVTSIHEMRTGQRWTTAYPPGVLASMALFLQLLPWVDSASGAFGASLGLAVLAPAAVFGLSWSIWRNTKVAAAGALVTALTFQFPYDPHVWSGWPIAAGTLMMLGLWGVAVEYVEQPSLRWVALAAVLAAGIAVTHGTEVYSALIVLALVLCAYRTRIRWTRLIRDGGLAVLLALALAAPYLGPVLGWARAGGVGNLGFEALTSNGSMFRTNNPLLEFFLFWLKSVGAGHILLVPARMVLLGFGLWWIFRQRRGRHVAVVFLAFYGLALGFMYLEIPVVEHLFARTFPWGFRGRLEQIQSVSASMVSGVGLIALALQMPRLRDQFPRILGTKHPLAWRRTVIAAVVVGLFVMEGSAITVYKTLSFAVQAAGTYSPDDAAAMAWLRQHAGQGDVVANDWAADAGVWAPFKANVRAVAGPRKYTPLDQAAQLAFLDKIGALDREPRVRAQACAAGVRYVFRGASGTAWEERSFPPLEQMRRSAALEEVFSSGDAAVFQLRPPCTGQDLS